MVSYPASALLITCDESEREDFCFIREGRDGYMRLHVSMVNNAQAAGLIKNIAEDLQTCLCL